MTEFYQAAQKLKNIKKVKSILRIDNDLAQNMKDEIEGVKSPKNTDNEEENTAGTSEKESGRVMVDSSLIEQVDRLKKVIVLVINNNSIS